MWKDPYGNMIGSHVDDMCIVATPKAREELKTALEAEGMMIHDLGELDTYIGIQITRDRTRKQICLYQEEYGAKVLKIFGMDDCHPVFTPIDTKNWTGDNLSAGEKKNYQKLIGCLLYMMHATRPDFSFAVIRLLQFASKLLTDHWLALKRILRYLKGTLEAKLILGDVNDEALIGFFDSAYADATNRRSTCGYLFHYYGSPISWASKVQKTIALSTVEAEYMAATEAAKQCVWIQSVAKQMGLPVNHPIQLFEDNQGANALTHNPEHHQRNKHIDVHERFVSSLVEGGVLSVMYIPTERMLADIFTKGLSRARHQIHCQLIVLCISTQHKCMQCDVYFITQKHLHSHILSSHLNKRPRDSAILEKVSKKNKVFEAKELEAVITHRGKSRIDDVRGPRGGRNHSAEVGHGV